MNPKEYAYSLVAEIGEFAQLDLNKSNRVAQWMIQKRLEDPYFADGADKDVFLINVLSELIEEGWK